MQQEQKDLLQALYEDYRDSLRLAVLSRGVPECEVDDIIQDTFCAFMRAYKEDALVWNIAQRKGVLMKILINRCADYFRDLKRRRTISMDSKDSDIEYEILRYHVRRDICDILIVNEEIRQIHEEIMKMKPALREVALLHMVEGRPVKEVCEILSISNPACRMRIMRIRKYLKELLKKMH